MDMTLRLDNACGIAHMPTAAAAAAADENPIIGFGFGIDQASQMVPGKVRPERLSPRARSTRNGGRDQIGILGDLKSECLGEFIGIRTIGSWRTRSPSRTGPPSMRSCSAQPL